MTSSDPMPFSTWVAVLALLLGLVFPPGDAQATSAPPRPSAAADSLPPGFVYLADVDSTIQQEMRYYGAHNFVGRRIEGYEAPACILTRQAAEALARVQADLRPRGLSLKVYDCYRPQRAVDHFVQWSRSPGGWEMKKEFFPDLTKARLFPEGYIASRSGHSRGSTIDLTVVPVPTPTQPAFRPEDPLVPCTAPHGERFPDSSLDMGTGYDCFSPRSHTDDPDLEPQARANRQLLRTAMERRGFRNYPKEWWHFTLRGEPHPDTYFDFPVLPRPVR